MHRAGEKILEVRISVGPSGPVPRRMKKAEDVLRDQIYCDEIVDLAYEALLDEANFRTSRHRATKEYRQQMVGVLLEDVLENAWQKAAVA